MKSIALLTMMAAFLGGSPVANAHTDQTYAPSEMVLPSGVSLNYDANLEVLYVKLAPTTDKGLTSITVYNNLGKVIGKEIIKMGAKSTKVKIEMAGHPAGFYKVHVAFPSSDFSDRFEKK